jgi:hypothetical protein
MRRSKQSKQVVWHYTYSNNIAAISESGVLLPPIMCPNYTARMRSSCASHNLPTHLVDTKAAVADARLLLFSEREDWEPASFRGFRNVRTGEVTDLHRLEDYAEYGCDVYRIGVQRGILHPWMRLKELVRMPHGMGVALEQIAREIGSNPYDWWGTTKPVPDSQWQAVEVYTPETGLWDVAAERINEATEQVDARYQTES